MITILFTQSPSVYDSLNVDCWNISRDARNWPGGNQVIAHPPCRAWGRFKAWAKPRPDEKELARFAVTAVRKNGGILEHPSSSSLWPDQELPYPGKTDKFGGYTICVMQSWWDHKAAKKTFLYIVGCSQVLLPPIPLKLDAIAYGIRSADPCKKDIPKAEREATPIEFAKWLITAASRCSPEISINTDADKRRSGTFVPSL